MRIFFLPGYGETPSAFDKIHPHIPGEKLFPDNWRLLGSYPRPELNALQYARELVAGFGIRKEDVLIGHSMGGWVALHIKHLVKCPIIQISSWTDRRKVVSPIRNRHLIYRLTKSGFVYNPIAKKIALRPYKGKPSREVFSSVLEKLIRANKEAVVNQQRVIFNPVEEAIREKPDLRIHARPDTIIRFPDEPTYEVPGDHFSLWTYPEKVYPPILGFLRGI